jgi:hypothetical protein
MPRQERDDPRTLPDGRSLTNSPAAIPFAFKLRPLSSVGSAQRYTPSKCYFPLKISSYPEPKFYFPQKNVTAYVDVDL